ncbi:hypothetical protein [Streptosporangium sp. NPDC052375]
MTEEPWTPTTASRSAPGWTASPDSTLTLRLPVTRPDVAVPVVELFLKS